MHFNHCFTIFQSAWNLKLGNSLVSWHLNHLGTVGIRCWWSNYNSLSVWRNRWNIKGLDVFFKRTAETVNMLAWSILHHVLIDRSVRVILELHCCLLIISSVLMRYYVWWGCQIFIFVDIVLRHTWSWCFQLTDNRWLLIDSIILRYVGLCLVMVWPESVVYHCRWPASTLFCHLIYVLFAVIQWLSRCWHLERRWAIEGGCC